MGKQKKVGAVLAAILLVGLFGGCGEKEYAAEYGVDGYVWPARKLQSMDGMEDIRMIGEYLYFLQNTGSGKVVGRVDAESMFADGGNAVNFSGQEILVSSGSMILELPDGAGAEIDLAALMANGSSVSDGKIDLEKEYVSLSLAEYAVDREGNLYYYMSAFIGPYLEMNAAGGVLCRQAADEGQGYRIYLPDMADLAVDGDGRVFVLTEGAVLILDQNGSQMGRIATEGYGSGENGAIEDLFGDSDGRVYYSTVAMRNNRYIRKTYEIIGEDGFHMEDAGDLLGEGDMEYSASLDGNIFLFTANSRGDVYEYDRKAGIRKKLLNMWDSGLESFGLREVVRVSPDILLVNYSDGGVNGIFQLTRTLVEELPEREQLVIASPNASYELRQAVMRFNARSSKYRIVIDDYESSFEPQGWVCTQLDASLVSSNPPDMIEFGLLNIIKYAEKGVLEDLAPYVEMSTVLNMDDIPDNVVKGLTFDNKFVCLPTSFCVEYVAARMWQTEELENWSMEDVYKFSEMYPKSAGELVSNGVGGRMERGWLLEEFCARYCLDKFVDWEQGTCSFDNEEFRGLLAWVEKYGADTEKEELSAGAVYRSYEYIPQNVMLVSRNLLNFESLAYLELQFGEEVRLLGYPTSDGKGCFPAKIVGGLGITSGSAHKEAAWEFIEFYREEGEKIGYLPVSKAEISESYEYLTTEEFLGYGVDGDPKWKDKGYIGMGDGELTAYYAIPKEQADAIMEVIETADFVPLSEDEETVIRIVTEEAAGYWGGVKSLEEVTEVIQNRVQLLLNERGKK